jgi:hypothetical protein
MDGGSYVTVTPMTTIIATDPSWRLGALMFLISGALALVPRFPCTDRVQRHAAHAWSGVRVAPGAQVDVTADRERGLRIVLPSRWERCRPAGKWIALLF